MVIDLKQTHLLTIKSKHVAYSGTVNKYQTEFAQMSHNLKITSDTIAIQNFSKDNYNANIIE